MLRAESRAWLGLLGRAVWGGVSVSLVLAALVLLAAPAEAANEQTGLRIYAADGTDLGSAPSLDTGVAIGIVGVIARVQVQQRFRNPGQDWVEGVYVFPLPQNAAVDRLRMHYGGRLIEGEIQERQQARQTYERARDVGRLAVRVELMVASPVLHTVRTDDADDFGKGIDLGLRTGFGDDRLRLGPVKVFSDGSLIGHTAAMCNDFSDTPGVRGYLQDDADALADTIVSAHRSGWRVATHAIGDSAIDLVLDAYERCMRDHPRTGWGGRAGNTAPRHRIEHFGVARPDQVERAARLGVVPVPQGRFVGEIGDGMRRALGPQRSEWAYRHASLLAAGIVVPGSSDRPVVDGRPMLGIHDIVNRRTASGEILGAAERVSAHEALRAYTYGSAYASYEEAWKGWIGPGTLADLAVLSDDPTRVDPAALADIDVLATVVGGKVVWDAGLGIGDQG